MEHPYFRSVNFDDIYHKRVPPPFTPQLSSATDTSNFDQEFTREVPVLTPVHSGIVSVGKSARANSSAYAGYARTVPRVQFCGGPGYDLTLLYHNSFFLFEGHDFTCFVIAVCRWKEKGGGELLLVTFRIYIPLYSVEEKAPLIAFFFIAHVNVSSF